MKPDRIQLTVVLPAPPADIYQAWLDGRRHGAMTGARATGSARVGARFTAWDGYVEGRNVELEPCAHIVQDWRAEDFPEDAPPSRLALALTAVKGGTRLQLTHTELPAGMGEGYAQGWRDFYFEPMLAYFARRAAARSTEVSTMATKKVTKKKAAKKAAKKVVKKAAKKVAKKAAKKVAKKVAKKAAKKSGGMAGCRSCGPRCC